MATQRFDLIIFGAAGMTGRFAVEAIHKVYLENNFLLNYAVADKSKETVKEILKGVQERTGFEVTKAPIFEANVFDKDALRNVVKKTKILINCVGPYIHFGEQVVEACMEEGTHYIDVSGEALFINRMLEKFNDVAKEKKLYIINACGSECFWADMGTVFLQQHFEGTLHSMSIFAHLSPQEKTEKTQALNRGSWESIVYMGANYRETSKLRTKLSKSIAQTQATSKQRFYVSEDPIFKKKGINLPTADTLMVQRTQQYFYETENKRPVKMDQMSFLFSSHLNAVIACCVFAIIVILSQFDFGRKFLLKYQSLITFGLSDTVDLNESDAEKWIADVGIIGKGWKETLTGSNILQDPKIKFNKELIFYTRTSNPISGFSGISAVLAGAMILTEKNNLPSKGGVYSPGAALAKTSIMTHLKKHVTIEIFSPEDKKEIFLKQN